ncbi:hypothetical protein IFM89_008813 [Coptis chinensis]|uniref:Uncharacterized protein n=1 Tax=Coptis chinensis TaxID=261450 RepID=A0A835LKX4_9MAGN|nr:hypothetical protein IFM89_008813 [Coptis chinensis]
MSGFGRVLWSSRSRKKAVKQISSRSEDTNPPITSDDPTSYERVVPNEETHISYSLRNGGTIPKIGLKGTWTPPWKGYIEHHYVQRAKELTDLRCIVFGAHVHTWYLGERCRRQVTGETSIPCAPPSPADLSQASPATLQWWSENVGVPAASLVRLVSEDQYKAYWGHVSVGMLLPALHRANGQIIHHHIEPLGRESVPQLPISDQMSRAKMKAMLEDVLHANASKARVISHISNGMYGTQGDLIRAFNDTVGHSSSEDQHTHSQVFETHMTPPGGVYYPQFEPPQTSRRHSSFHGDSSFDGVRSTFQGDSSGKGCIQGSDVRKKSQSLVVLVNDKERILEARQKASANRDKRARSLAMFPDMRKVDMDGNSFLLAHNSKEFVASPGSKHGSSPIFKIVSSPKACKSVGDKNDYDCRLERKFSEQNIALPPPYEEDVTDARSPVHDERFAS